jgi:hypothetical protein
MYYQGLAIQCFETSPLFLKIVLIQVDYLPSEK